MIFKIIVISLLLVIIVTLGQSLYYLVRDGGNTGKMHKSLTKRIGLAVFLFILLLIGQAMGWIQPHGLF